MTTSVELRKCTRCHSKIMLSYYSKNRKGLYFKTCDKCRKYNKIYHVNNKEKKNLTSLRYARNNPIEIIISNCRLADKRTNRFFNLDKIYVQHVLDNQEYHCYSCNNILEMSNGNNHNRKQFSIDRVDNVLGHIKGNVVASCLFCNLSRGSKSIDDFTPYQEYFILDDFEAFNIS